MLQQDVRFAARFRLTGRFACTRNTFERSASRAEDVLPAVPAAPASSQRRRSAGSTDLVGMSPPSCASSTFRFDGGDKPDIDFDRPRSTNFSPNSRSCRTRKQFRLEAAAPASPISPRNRVAGIGDFDLPFLALIAPVNAPRSWPNSSLSNNGFRQRRAVDSDKRPVRPLAVAMNGARNQLLARAAFAANQTRLNPSAATLLTNSIDIAHARRSRPPCRARY